MFDNWNWASFIAGIIFALFVFPFITSMLAGRKNARAAA